MSTSSGLSSVEAAERLALDGPNRLPMPKPLSLWRQLAAELFHFFALMLWAAGLLAIVAGMPQLGVAIFVVIVVNGLFSFAQERRAERAAERLRDLLPAGVVVRRDGELRTIDASEVVTGDRLVLGPGDRVAGDLVVAESHGLSVDESMLTGESVPVPLVAGSNAHAGTYVVSGEGEGVVTATGGRTRLAELAELSESVRRPRSPLAGELDRIVRTIAFTAVVVGAVFFVLAVVVGTPARDGFLFAIGVTVALVPEGLLPTVTLSLAMGAQQMARRNALVRHLEAVETLGSTTFVCTDKTGTLTRNEMNVVEAWTPAGTVVINGNGYEPVATLDGIPRAVEAAHELGRAALCVQGRAVEADGAWTAVGDPMDAALHAFANRMGMPVTDSPAITRRFPFDPDRRRSSVMVDGGDLVVIGAPDSVLPRCLDAPSDGVVLDMAERGLRVIAVARRRLDATEVDTTLLASAVADDLERDLVLVGVVGLQDPPRAGVGDALATCRRAGIRVAMLTGDHPATARAIARQIGLLGPDEIVVTGAELPSDDAMLGALIDRDGVVISRVAPEDKLRVARVLQQRGHVVAMTGDGVNDGPALREADIGIAMGRSGTDVARQAADLVLLDDDFATIVAAVDQGRSTFANIRRFLTYHLTDNVAELTPFVVWALSGGRIPLALTVLQILCLDIGTDLLPALALGGEPARADALDRPPTTGHLIDAGLLKRVFFVLGPTEATVEMLAFFVAMITAGWRPGGSFPEGHPLVASGAAFMAVVLGQVANAFACRSVRHPPWRLGWFTNRGLIAAVAVEIVLLAGFLLVGPVARLLKHAWPSWPALLVAVGAIPAVLIADASFKSVNGFRRRK